MSANYDALLGQEICRAVDDELPRARCGGGGACRRGVAEHQGEPAFSVAVCLVGLDEYVLRHGEKWCCSVKGNPMQLIGSRFIERAHLNGRGGKTTQSNLRVALRRLLQHACACLHSPSLAVQLSPKFSNTNRKGDRGKLFLNRERFVDSRQFSLKLRARLVKAA